MSKNGEYVATVQTNLASKITFSSAQISTYPDLWYNTELYRLLGVLLNFMRILKSEKIQGTYLSILNH